MKCYPLRLHYQSWYILKYSIEIYTSMYYSYFWRAHCMLLRDWAILIIVDSSVSTKIIIRWKICEPNQDQIIFDRNILPYSIHLDKRKIYFYHRIVVWWTEKKKNILSKIPNIWSRIKQFVLKNKNNCSLFVFM